jgi:MFS family permease
MRYNSADRSWKLQGLTARVGESLRTLGDTLRNRNLRLLELATTGSVLGNWGYLVALYVYAYDQGGAAAVGLVTVIRMIPAAAAAPFTASLADRFDRKLVMIAADVVRAGLMALAAVTIWVDGPTAAVYCIVALSTITSGAFLPAEAALLPSLARSPGELTAANVALSTVISTSEFVGPALGGLLLVVTSIPLAFLVNGASFLWSAALLLGISGYSEAVAEPKTENEPTEQEPSSPRFAEVTAGARAILGNRDLRLLSGLYTAQTLVAGALEVLIVVIAFDLLGAGEGGIGYLNAAVGAGGLVGGFVALVLATRHRLASDFGLGIVLYGIPLTLIAVSDSTAIAVASLAIIGLGNSLVDISAITIMQRTVPDAVLGRALGALDAILLASIGIGAMVTPWLIHVVGLRATLIGTGVLLPLLVIPTVTALRSLDSHAAPAHLAVVQAIDILGALPEATLERLALSLQEVRLPAGSIVIREGESGDLFYVIGEGEVEVAGRTLEPGDSFGEIALLRDVPRTATVTATTDVVLYTLERDIFVAAVTGHEPAHASAEAVIAARLEAFASDRVRFIS